MSFGGALIQRFPQYSFLLEFARAWTHQAPEGAEALLSDPEAFREFLFSLERKAAASEVEALQYIVFPDYFEPITSVDHKRKIAKSFAAYAGDPSLPVDRQLSLVRAALTPDYGSGFSFYDEPIRAQWETSDKSDDGGPDVTENDAWSELLDWAEKLYKRKDFDARERDYKLTTGQALTQARNALDAGKDWLPLLLEALRQTNLVHYIARSQFADWATAHPEDCAHAVRTLWADETVSEQTIDQFVALLGAPATAGNRVVLASVLLLGIDATRYPPFRPRVDARARKLLGIAPPGSTEPGARYFAFTQLCDELADRMGRRGVPLRDRLDAQSLLWWITHSPPPSDWSEEENAAFLAYQKGEQVEDSGSEEDGDELVTGSSRRPRIPAVDDALAKPLFLPKQWLQEAVDLLNEKRQVIFYGPPGTGKTYVARALCEHVSAAGGGYRLVQFHPSYSYEDFFEGYRPSDDNNHGAIQFELRPGPLRLLAEEAAADPEHPYLLVIDEINRGNIAKVFGELYFLLEYRDEPIQLQYSPRKPFQLPVNLFVIGTMNTADRSIALVDSALRRRFYFFPFLPDEQPVSEVLGNWLADREYDDEPAGLLRALNDALREALPGEEFAVGPSYLMPADGPPNLERVWRYAIGPLLEERFYGARTPHEIDQEFGLAALRNLARGDSATAENEEAPAEGGSSS